MTWWGWVLVALAAWAVLSVACALLLGRVLSWGHDHPTPPAPDAVVDPYRRSVDA